MGPSRPGLNTQSGRSRPLLFSGSATGTQPNGGSVVAERLQISYKYSDFFRIWTDRSCASDLPYTGWSAIFLGDGASYGTSVPAYIPGDDFVSGDYKNYYCPLSIAGHDRVRSLAIIGDRNDYCDKETADGDGGATGPVARSVDPWMGYIRIAVPGETVALFLADNAVHLALALTCTDVMIGYGTNDVAGSVS